MIVRGEFDYGTYSVDDKTNLELSRFEKLYVIRVLTSKIRDTYVLDSIISEIIALQGSPVNEDESLYEINTDNTTIE